MTSRTHRLLLWMAVADEEVVADCGAGEARRLASAGGAVLGTSVLAVLTATFTFHQILRVPIVPACAFGVGFGVLILNLERFVQASICRQSNWLTTLAQAAPRVGLAILVGLLMSPAVLLKAFASEDAKQVHRDKVRMFAVATTQINKEFAEIPALRRREGSLRRSLGTIDSGEILKTNTQYRIDVRRYAALISQARHAPTAALQARYARQADDTRLRVLAPLRRRLLKDEATSAKTTTDEERASVTGIARRIRTLQTEKGRKLAPFEQDYRAPAGLAEQLQALDEVVRREPTVGAFKRILWLFVLAIDALPAVMKTLSVIGRPTEYEQVKDAHETAATQAAQRLAAAREAEIVREATAQIAAQQEISEARLRLYVKAQLAMDETFVTTMTEVIYPHAETWASRAAEAYIAAMDHEVDWPDAGAAFADPPDVDGGAASARPARPGIVARMLRALGLNRGRVARGS